MQVFFVKIRGYIFTFFIAFIISKYFSNNSCLVYLDGYFCNNNIYCISKVVRVYINKLYTLYIRINRSINDNVMFQRFLLLDLLFLTVLFFH